MLSPISATLRMVCLKAHTTESMKILNWGGGICRYAARGGGGKSGSEEEGEGGRQGKWNTESRERHIHHQ